MATSMLGTWAFVAAFAAIVSAVAVAPARAQSNQELLEIIRQQQRQIEELSRKVEALASQVEGASEKADDASEQAGTATQQAVAATETANQVAEDSDVEFKWGPAPTLMSKDGSWLFKVRGRMFVDGGYLDDTDGEFDDTNATELRAARLGVQGKVFRDFAYTFEADFADNDVEVKDAFIQYDGPAIAPVRYVRIGQHKTPNSLEELTSSNYTTFMERAAITDAFELNRRIGLASGVGGDNWGVDVGLFGQSVDEQARNEGFAIAGRGHYAFQGLASEDSFLHLGSSVRFRDLDNSADDSQARYRQRPFFHFTSTRSVDTGTIDNADNDVFLGGEVAWVDGRFSVQSEAAHTWLQRSGGGGDAEGLWGGYLSASYFLTDAMRTYNPKSGTFGRVKVSNPVHDGGIGAWEVGARYDYIALNDGGANIRGGKQGSTIVGVNWYLNDYIRMVLDGSWTHVYDARGSQAAVTGSSNDIFGVGARAQVDF